MNYKDYLINLLLEVAQKHKDDPEVYEAVCEVIKVARTFGCRICGWYREGTCTKHFPGYEVGPYDFCRDWMGKENGNR